MSGNPYHSNRRSDNNNNNFDDNNDEFDYEEEYSSMGGFPSNLNESTPDDTTIIPIPIFHSNTQYDIDENTLHHHQRVHSLFAFNNILVIKLFSFQIFSEE